MNRMNGDRRKDDRDRDGKDPAEHPAHEDEERDYMPDHHLPGKEQERDREPERVPPP